MTTKTKGKRAQINDKIQSLAAQWPGVTISPERTALQWTVHRDGKYVGMLWRSERYDSYDFIGGDRARRGFRDVEALLVEVLGERGVIPVEPFEVYFPEGDRIVLLDHTGAHAGNVHVRWDDLLAIIETLHRFRGEYTDGGADLPVNVELGVVRAARDHFTGRGKSG